MTQWLAFGGIGLAVVLALIVALLRLGVRKQQVKELSKQKEAEDAIRRQGKAARAANVTRFGHIFERLRSNDNDQ